MDPHRSLSQAFLRAHPEDAARQLERLPLEELAAYLEETPAADAVAVLERMAAPVSADCLALLSPARAGRALALLPVDISASLIRRLLRGQQEKLLAAASADIASTLDLLRRFPENTAGALMEPRVLAVHEDINVRQARERMRRAAGQVLYYLYVVDRAQRLVGVLNVRELLLASGKEPVTAIMRSDVARISVHADRRAILTHGGWREFHALPVVDDDGRLVGLIRYRTLRILEEQAQATPPGHSALNLGLRLGELYWVALSGLLQGMTRRGRPASDDGPEGGAAHGA